MHPVPLPQELLLDEPESSYEHFEFSDQRPCSSRSIPTPADIEVTSESILKDASQDIDYASLISCGRTLTSQENVLLQAEKERKEAEAAQEKKQRKKESYSKSRKS